MIEQRVRNGKKTKFNNLDPADEVTAPVDNNADFSCKNYFF